MNMDDLVERLRKDTMSAYSCANCDEYLKVEAADEIERLRAALRQLAEIDKIENGFIRIKEVIHYTRFMARAALREATDDAAT
jgi:hypothetical protein